MSTFTELCKKIKELTLVNVSLIQNDIEACHQALISRQLLLDQLKGIYLTSPEKHQEYFPVFFELLNWIQEQDGIDLNTVVGLRAQNKNNSLKQVKVNKALQHYKKIT